MLNLIRQFVKHTSSRRGVKITLTLWVLAVVALSVLAPSAKEYEQNSEEVSVSADRPSEIAEHLKEQEFPSDDGLTALLVFHKDDEWSTEDRLKLEQLSEWLASNNRPEHIASALMFHQFPDHVQNQMFSEDMTTLLFNVTLKQDLSTEQVHVTLGHISDKVNELNIDNVEFDITGPAGITADTKSLFQNGDFVLMIGTIVLIFVLLIVIYRSPILAVTPLIIAGLVYGVVDRLLGLAGKYGWFAVDGAAVSIMLVLLFAVVTDYSLFIFSRYREALQKNESKYTAMSEAIYHVSEPIYFSGGTILLAMLTLFATVFEPYRAFAPVFSIAVIVILVAGLTLIPSVFALMGRRAFWPSIPKIEKHDKEGRHTFWGAVSRIVKKRPVFIATGLIILMGIGVFNVTKIDFSFNLLKSFPEEMSSRQGFERLEAHYPAGQLAPVDVLIQSEEDLREDPSYLKNVASLIGNLEARRAVSSVSPQLSEDVINGSTDVPQAFLSDDGHVIKLRLTLNSNPYEAKALDFVKKMRDTEGDILTASGFSTEHVQLHFGGQTAQQLDVRELNERDMIVLFVLVIVLITLVLGFQTRSILLPTLMVGTILLSYGATLGFSWWIIEHFMGYDSISYRIPVYTFVFMVALGVDYNIMLVSRIREYAHTLSWKDAVSEGVKKTGGVISSAGLILAATFAVLMTQPLQELFLFGFMMAFGILLDTFIIRGFLMPSLLLITHRSSK
ncbi:MMPL family transporter [Lentibacillus saliphilus]|uniref:MMPL family transporter n=1 Tax=Lentibacillus saliphilus TaxID=2737028 RepID=UPI001C304E97|nr:MMPL family transporter [Lentibacillus saliphilus]